MTHVKRLMIRDSLAPMSENELLEWQQRFSDTAELLPGVICEIDMSLRITYVNMLGLESFKYTKEDFDSGVTLRQLVHQDDRQRCSSNITNLLNGKSVGPQEYRMVHKDGVVVEYQVNSSPIFEGDTVVGIRTCVFDISERKRAENRIKQSEARFRRIFSQSPIGVALFNRGGKLVDYNGAFSQMFALPEDASASPEFPLLFSLVTIDAEQRDLLENGARVQCSSMLSLPGAADSAEARHLDWHIAPFGDDDQRDAMLLTQVQDVTERRMAEEAKLTEARSAADAAKRLVENLRKEVQQTFSFNNMVSRSPQMRKIFDVLPQMAETTTTVLVSGESGTGKELIARALHELGPRKTKPFVAINCSALPDNLLESELFGYKAGAFTDAKKDKPGKFALAEEGVLFLDEIGDISPAMQVKLLRVLQERTYEPLGGTASVKADVRLVAATNRDLPAMVKSGEFRDDLFYRMNVLKIKLPPLKARLSDIPLLCDHFIGLLNQRYDRKIEGMSPTALDLLLTHAFPGNIRELENIIEHAFVFCKEGNIEVEHLPEEIAGPGEKISEVKALQSFGSLDELEAKYILAILEETGGNRLEAARKLGIHKSTLFRKLKKLGITSDDA